MTNLISGKEALIALANDELVEMTDIEVDMPWTEICVKNNDFFGKVEPCPWMFVNQPEHIQFRLKSRTITINGIEVPCCGKDYQYGDAMYILNSLEPEEYSLVVLDKVDEVPLYWWRTEEEVKQVVEALRQVFDLSDDAVNAVRGGK